MIEDQTEVLLNALQQLSQQQARLAQNIMDKIDKTSFENMINECLEEQQETNFEKSKWVIRMEIDAEKMLDKNITMDDINFAISNSYDKDVQCDNRKFYRIIFYRLFRIQIKIVFN